MRTKILDASGRELQLGCFIAYPGSLGRSPVIKLGVVRSLDLEKGKIGVYNSYGSKSTISYPRHCIVLNEDQLPNSEARTILLEKRALVVPIYSAYFENESCSSE